MSSPLVSRGMTLIEMLVVLLIMGLLVSVTVLSTGVVSRGDSSVSGVALRVAEDLSRMFEHASQQAVAKNEVLGWGMQDNQQMSWWRWASAPLPALTQSPAMGVARASGWQVDESAIKAFDLPDDLALQVNVINPGNVAVSAISDVQSNAAPAVVFFPGREYSAFEIYVLDGDSSRALARVWAESNGRFNWGAL